MVVLTAPRQSGKTTLLRHSFGSRHRYVHAHVGKRLVKAPKVYMAVGSDAPAWPFSRL